MTCLLGEDGVDHLHWAKHHWRICTAAVAVTDGTAVVAHNLQSLDKIVVAVHCARVPGGQGFGALLSVIRATVALCAKYPVA